MGWDGAGDNPAFLTRFQVTPVSMHSLSSKTLDCIVLIDIKFCYQPHQSLTDDSGQVNQAL